MKIATQRQTVPSVRPSAKMAVTGALRRTAVDPGRAIASPGARISGITPPARNSAGQPPAASREGATKPPMAGPMAKPQTVTVTKAPRCFAGAYSATRAIAAGMAPPRPMPVRKRRATKRPTLWTKAVRVENSPNAATEPTMTVRRPSRSPSAPSTSPPSIRPNSPALATGPKAGRPTWKALIRAGAA